MKPVNSTVMCLFVSVRSISTAALPDEYQNAIYTKNTRKNQQNVSTCKKI